MHASKLQLVFVHGLEHRLRARLTPYIVHEVGFGKDQRHAARGQRGFECHGVLVRHERCIHTDVGATRHIGTLQPLTPRGYVRLADPVQGPRPTELLRCLDMVPAIGEQMRRISQHDRRRCASGKSGYVCQTLITRSRIFGRMGIFCPDHIRINTTRPHRLPQGMQPL